SGALTIKPSTASRNITIGAENASDFALNFPELAYLSTGFSSVTIGRSSDGTGTITVYPATIGNPTTIVGGAFNMTRRNVLSFDGVDDYVDLHSSIISDASAGTSGAWVQATTGRQ